MNSDLYIKFLEKSMRMRKAEIENVIDDTMYACRRANSTLLDKAIKAGAKNFLTTLECVIGALQFNQYSFAFEIVEKFGGIDESHKVFEARHPLIRNFFALIHKDNWQAMHVLKKLGVRCKAEDSPGFASLARSSRMLYALQHLGVDVLSLSYLNFMTCEPYILYDIYFFYELHGVVIRVSNRYFDREYGLYRKIMTRTRHRAATTIARAVLRFLCSKPEFRRRMAEKSWRSLFGDADTVDVKSQSLIV